MEGEYCFRAKTIGKIMVFGESLLYSSLFLGAKKLVNAKPLEKMIPVDDYLPIMYDRHPNETWKKYFSKRNLKAYSIAPRLVFPTHFELDEGWISDTENSAHIVEHVEL